MGVGLVRSPLLCGQLGQGDVAPQPVRPCLVASGPGTVPLQLPEPYLVKDRKVSVGHGVHAAVPPRVASLKGHTALGVEPASSLNRSGSEVGVVPNAVARGLVQAQGSQNGGLSAVTPCTGGVQESIALLRNALQVHRQLRQLGPGRQCGGTPQASAQRSPCARHS